MTIDQNSDMKTMTGEASNALGSVASELQAAASRTYDSTMAEVKSQANDAKDTVANEVNDVAMALRRASEELRGGSAQERSLGQIASSLADASDALRDKDLGELLQSASRVARDNPVLFLGGAALLGFAVSRFAKASSDHTSHAPKASSSQAKGNAYSFIKNEPGQGERQEGPQS